MADQGRTDEARKLCEAALASRPPPADAYYLLGLLQAAHGLAAEAESCLQKAVYLEPDHVQALAHLALNAQWRGDAKAAELFRQRARRAEAKQARQRHARISQ
jgi:chemotaxis protein methyltransferase WspC